MAAMPKALSTESKPSINTKLAITMRLADIKPPQFWDTISTAI